MAGGTYLEPSINISSSEAYNYESVPRGINQAPENQFESALNNAYGTTNALSFLASDGVAFANAENPSFGGTIVSTGISNMAGTQFSGAGGYGGGTGFNASFNTGGGYGATGVTTQLLNGNTGTGFPGISNVSNTSGANTSDGFNSGGVKQGILDEGLQQIMLMVEVQQASRTLDAMSNILKTAHDTNMNSIRNIKS